MPAALATKPMKMAVARRSVKTRAAAAAGEVPSMEKRRVMNMLTVGAVGLPATAILGPYVYQFIPPGYVLTTETRSLRFLRRGFFLKTRDTSPVAPSRPESEQ